MIGQASKISGENIKKNVRQEFSAGAVVFYMNRKARQREYLILRYDAGHWDLPKGHIEAGEELLDTVRREVKEETGIRKLAIAPGYKQHIKYSFANKYGGRYKPGKVFKVVTFFAARAYTKKVTLSHEHKGYLWLPYRAAMKRTTFPKARSVLREAEMFLRRRAAQYRT